MVLHIHSDTSYLSESEAHSYTAAIYFLGNNFADRTKPCMILTNGIIHVLCNILKNVMFFAKEAEIEATFLTAKDTLPLRVSLTEWGIPPI